MSKNNTDDLGPKYSRDEDLRVPAKPGEPPRPATEPPGAKRSSGTNETMTDPATGVPNKRGGGA